jgi:NAD(P)-dependent dehydrogenase (short-subunit alcohol dehydrogenase family)
LETARALLASGHRVAITGRDPETLDAAATQLLADAPDGSVLAVPGHQGSAEHRTGAIDRVIAEFGRLDVLVNNVGTNPVAGKLVEMDLAAASKILDTNVVAMLGWVQLAQTAGIAEHDGAIVNVASMGGLQPVRDSGLYNISKAAVLATTRQLASELAPRIRVNAVAPGVVRTRFSTPVFEGREDAVTRQIPLGRLGSARDVANAIEFLASERASWITGATVVVDGGILQSEIRFD